MRRITVILFVLILFGCAKTEEASDTPINIPYEVGHSHIESTSSSMDVYSVVIYQGSGNTLKLAKFLSKNESYYYLSLLYVGENMRSMSGAVVIDVDGFKSEFRDYEPSSSTSIEGVVTESVTVILNKFLVYDMSSAKNLQIEFKYEPPFAIPPDGVANIGKFIVEMEEG